MMDNPYNMMEKLAEESDQAYQRGMQDAIAIRGLFLLDVQPHSAYRPKPGTHFLLGLCEVGVFGLIADGYLRDSYVVQSYIKGFKTVLGENNDTIPKQHPLDSR